MKETNHKPSRLARSGVAASLSESYVFKPHLPDRQQVMELHAGAVELDALNDKDCIGTVKLARGARLTLAQEWGPMAMMWTEATPDQARRLVLVHVRDVEADL